MDRYDPPMDDDYSSESDSNFEIVLDYSKAELGQKPIWNWLHSGLKINL